MHPVKTLTAAITLTHVSTSMVGSAILATAIAPSAQAQPINVIPPSLSAYAAPDPNISPATTEADPWVDQQALGNTLAYWQQRTLWRAVELPEAGFRVLMPDQPRYGRLGAAENSPQQEQHFISAFEPSYGALYMVGWSHAPLSLLGDEQAQSYLFETERNALLNRFQGQLLQAAPVQLQGYPGQHYKLLGDVQGETFVITHRSYLLGDRLYQMTVAVPQRQEAGFIGMAEGFLQSFRPL